MVFPLHLSVALDGTGWHPAAWREPDARPDLLCTPGYWTGLVAEAERGLLDLVTVEDALVLQSSAPHGPDDRLDRVRGRLDAVQVAARAAPVTAHVGLVPVVTVTHTEPFHTSRAVATLDYASTGRAGWCARVTDRVDEAAHFGRRRFPVPRADLHAEAADYVEVVRRLWDSWDDDAVIRDRATGRFLDRDKLHHVDFRGRWFSVAGPSTTPRPPQGQPVVCAAAHDDDALAFAAGAADVVLVAPRDAEDARRAAARVRAACEAAGRDGPVHVFAELTVFVDEEEGAAAERAARLDALGHGGCDPGAPVFTGTPAALADLLESWWAVGITGFRLRPAALPHDLRAVTRAVAPELGRRGVFRTRYEAGTLRGLLGLARPAGRYAAAAVRSS
ncbi:LLM class flavin-dependent oxidoreductase [Saccharothrix australiensis]|uniref:Alkanesulfonate monooxygenase SsuD/methylene tetrahydromethanopterin reductase-like flavin-dependent oxidoreductase (Luciferase family) n=1 Tax=Saccharothrix australiensis TaxID=2072 RepID=A0A495W1S7_9PSEU|nr:LLM class flavin-dependent oxidoreductase [Saccharothrix australiensis]RKT54673.1 alkanesulfonate monooxygenase SsuD/methylene tetrahydromethanopterin reductase-like flavin-dependent oxidoreductase (luciferase family) [Saccharothrix australiensis]